MTWPSETGQMGARVRLRLYEIVTIWESLVKGNRGISGRNPGSFLLARCGILRSRRSFPMRVETVPMADERTQDRMAFLDVARGLAALLVLIEHGICHRIPGYVEWSAANANVGRTGVVLFLAISGFIIPVSLERSGSNARFWLRRFFRLYPAYWASIAIAGLYLWFGGPVPLGVGIDDRPNWLLNLTMLQRFFGRPDVWGVFWTLQLELVIYAACSLFFVTGLLRRWRWIVGVAIVGYLVLGLERPLIEAKPLGIGGQRFLYFTPLIGLLAQRYVAGIISRRATYGILAAHVVSVVAVWCVNRLLFPSEITAAGLREFLLTWGTAYTVLFALAEVRHLRMPAVGTWLGRISYSLYLFHPLLLVLLNGFPTWQFIPCFFIGTILLAHVTNSLIEAPGIAAGRKLDRRLFGKRRAETTAGRKADQHNPRLSKQIDREPGRVSVGSRGPISHSRR
jgi:peptidoglycan/LPS O-acetylase OafA/YrhL